MELLEATNRGDEEEVEKLLEAGANPNIQDWYGRTSLHYPKSPEITNLLLNYNVFTDF